MAFTAHLNAKRHLVWSLTASALLLLSLVELIFAREPVTGLVIATLFGPPAAWFLVRAGMQVLSRINKADPFSPFVAFPIAYVLWFGLGSLTFWFDADPPRYFYFVLGLLAYLAGALVMRRRSTPIGGIYGVSKRSPWARSRFRLVALMFFLLMAGSYLLLVAQVGIPAIHADAAFRREALDSHRLVTAVFQSSASTLMVFAAADLFSSERILAPLVSGGIVSLAGLMLGSFGNRGFLVVPILTLLILWHYWKKPIPAGRLAAILAAVFLINVAFMYLRGRALIEGSEAGSWSDVLYTSAAFTLHTSLGNFRDIEETIPSQFPYQHGYLTFGVLTQILPGHHESSDFFFKRILGSDFVGGGQPGTVLGPFYGDFGVAGIVAGMFLFGAFIVRVYGWMEKGPTLFRVLMYSWLAQIALLSLYGALVTYIISLWLPFMWWVLHRWMSGALETLDR